MEDFYINGFRVHVSIKIPHLHEKEEIYSYQFLIYNRIGKMMNYPFSRIIARNEVEFKSILAREFEYYIHRNEYHTYPVSKFVERMSENIL